MQAIIEIRNYQLRSGKGAQFEHIMQTQSMPLMRSAGVDVLVAQASLHAPDTFVLVRAYNSLAQRQESQAAFYGSPAWLAGPCEPIMACIESFATSVLAVDPRVAAALFASAASHSTRPSA